MNKLVVDEKYQEFIKLFQDQMSQYKQRFQLEIQSEKTRKKVNQEIPTNHLYLTFETLVKLVIFISINPYFSLISILFVIKELT